MLGQGLNCPLKELPQIASKAMMRVGLLQTYVKKLILNLTNVI